MAGKPMDFAPIEAEHDRIAADFQAHQEALVRAIAEPAAVDQARAAWQRFEARLRAHIRFEDEQLIPLFAARVQPAPIGCSQELLDAEHRKLERLLERCSNSTERHLNEARTDPASLLRLIEDQRGLREVLEHHDQRERAAFFPALDATLSDSERASLLEASLHAHPAVS